MNAQQLRNSILQQAIQGKLVPQDPADEPASVLLQRIRKEKERLVKEGKLKKKDLESKPIEEGEIPFEIPKSWEWCRVQDISQSYIGLTYKPCEVKEDGTIVLRSSNIQNGKLVLNDVVRVSTHIADKLWVKENDILICARNGSKKLVGKSAMIKGIHEPMTFGAFMAICKTPIFQFVYVFLQSDLFFSQLREVSGTTTINQLTQNNLNSFLIPIPPLAEQCRIVAKIEELMPLVERYGKAQDELDKLNESLSARLRQSILQEAIQGRLVPQDVNEGEVRIEKNHGKTPKKLSNFDDYLFDIPETWRWCKLYEIADVIGGYAFQSSDLKSDIGYRVIRISDVTPKGLSSKSIVRCNKKDIPNQYLIKEHDILIAMTGGTVGKSLLLESLSEVMYLNQRVAIIRAGENLYCNYLDLLVKSQLIQGIIGDVKNSTNDNISMVDILSFPVPLPPLSEQKRIVAKVEELFGILKEVK